MCVCNACTTQILGKTKFYILTLSSLNIGILRLWWNKSWNFTLLDKTTIFSFQNFEICAKKCAILLLYKTQLIHHSNKISITIECELKKMVTSPYKSSVENNKNTRPANHPVWPKRRQSCQLNLTKTSNLKHINPVDLTLLFPSRYDNCP